MSSPEIGMPPLPRKISEQTAKMAGAWMDTDEIAAKLEDINVRPIQSATMELDKSQPPTPDGTGRPENFAAIAPGIYRSSYPQYAHFDTLQDLELKTIITLVPEPVNSAYGNFISSNGITHHHIHIKANKDEEVYSPDATVHKVLNLLLDPENYPILIHCNKGKHRTGCMTACFRRVTGWPLEAAIEEYERFAQPKDRALDKVFIERYDANALKPLALERRLYNRVPPQTQNGGSGESTKSSIYTTYSYTTSTEYEEWEEGLDDEVKKRLWRDREMRESARLWNYR